MLISCKYCGRIHDKYFICDQKKRAKREQKRPDPTEADRMRNSTAWQKKAEQIKADSHYLCAVCYDEGIYTCDKLEVHHIEKLKDAKEKFIDDDNLICLCVKHHRQADAGLIDKKYLLKLARRRGSERF